MIFIQYPKCTTCKKAKKYLENSGAEFFSRHIIEETPSYDELIQWIQMSGLPIKKFFNTSGNVYKQNNLKDVVDNLTLEEAAKMLSENGMLIKRPLLIKGDRIVIGFNEEKYDEFLKKL